MDDGFVFLGHRIIRKRGPRGRMRPVTTIPWEKYRGFAEKLVKQLSSNYSRNRIDLVESLNRQLAGWATFYQYTDYTEPCLANWTEPFSGSSDIGWRASTGAASDRSCAIISKPRNRVEPKRGYFKARIVGVGMVRWHFDVSSPVASVDSNGGVQRRILTSCATRNAVLSSRAMLTLPLL